MSLSLTIDLNDRDLEHFTKAMDASRKAAEGKSNDEIIAAAVKMLSDAKDVHVPDFVRGRLLRLDDMIAMVRDEGWAMSDTDRTRVMSALVYFVDPADVIPDDVEVLGFLDDAIMIELCVRELHHELEAYDDFCDYREREATRRGIAPDKVGTADWLASRRDELVDRMHVRRERDFGHGYGSSSGYGSKVGSYTRAWRPGIFSVR